MGEERTARSDLSRRSFLKWGALATGMTAGAGLVACSPQEEVSEPKAEERVNKYLDGEWKSALCWAQCGGNCVNKVLVKDGVVVCQKTDTLGDDSYDNPQQRGCHRGRMLRRFVFSEQRLKYPLKRKNWQPGGGENSQGHLRGIDEWERITWDEAFDLAASEIKRIIADYGNESILSLSVMGSPRFMSAVGGCVCTYGPMSSGGFIAAADSMVGGGWPWHPLTLSDRFEWRKSKLIVLWGNNPVTTAQGAIYNLLAAKEAGAEFIVVDPRYTETAQVLGAEYVPVRPSTDAALLLSIAYEMIVNDLHDQEFLDKYCVGFDADHMPEGADPKENFLDYVLGTYDGIPKTPEWASTICGTPVDMIKSLAHRIATTKPLALTCARAAARTVFGEQFCQAFLTVGWMTGEVGKPGSMIGHLSSSNSGAGGGGPKIVSPGSAGLPGIPNPIAKFGITKIDPFDTETVQINQSEVWDAIINKEYTATSRGKQPIDIRMITNMPQGNSLNGFPGASKGIEAYRSVEFVLASTDRMNTSALYADIIFPEATPWEEEIDSVVAHSYYGSYLATVMNRDTAIARQQICQPLFESKTPYEINRGMATALGLNADEVCPYTDRQLAFNALQSSTVLNESGESEPLFTIEEDDIPEGVEGAVQSGRITLKQFFEDGLYKVERRPDDAFATTALKEYIDDPDANPRPTKSGKLEIYSQSLSDFVAACGFNERAPIAKYEAPTVGYESTFSDWAGQVKGEYPLQNYSTHTFRTAHSMFDGEPITREAFPNDLEINPVDASARGIEDGDTVLVTSAYGKVLRNAHVTERIMPCVTRLDEAAWIEVDPETGINKSGNPNILNPHLPSGSGISAYNAANVQVEKWTGEKLDPDYLWPERIVEA